MFIPVSQNINNYILLSHLCYELVEVKTEFHVDNCLLCKLIFKFVQNFTLELNARTTG